MKWGRPPFGADPDSVAILTAGRLVRAIFQDLHVRAVAVHAVASIAGDFFQEADLDQSRDQAAGSGIVGSGDSLNAADGHKRLPVEALQDAMAIGSGSAEALGDEGPVLLAKSEDASDGFGGLGADFGDAPQEEFQPAFPVTGVMHGLQAFVVVGAVLFEKVREVEHRLEQECLAGTAGR